MEVDWYYRLILLFILLILSAFFSGSEVALFSLDKNKIKELKKTPGILAKYITSLLETPRRLLVTILLGNTLVNVAASILAVTIALDAAPFFNISNDVALIIQIVLLTILILIAGEILPKVFASKNPLTFSKVICIPLYWASVFIFPISKILTDLIKFFSSKLTIDRSKTALLSSDLTELANLGIESGTIEEEEHELIHGLVSFKSVSVREVMTPRVDITAVSLDTNFKELMEIITTSGHSRIPLYNNNLDDVIGIIYAKDLLPFLADEELKEKLSLKTIARPAMFVPESKLISDLLHEFQEKNMHMGIVVDEYGGTAGLISLEDILEEIVGEIRDEYDNEENEITKIDENSYLVLGKYLIDELNDLIGEDFSSENDDYDTVGGFILNHIGTIPDEGVSFEYGNYKFTVKEIDNKRINKVLIEKIKSGTSVE
ncbi:MAG: hemolysin family protein [Bacteroidetes bacterium]|nr:hemolysin family protein [Bacteroidota bacterium]